MFAGNAGPSSAFCPHPAILSRRPESLRGYTLIQGPSIPAHPHLLQIPLKIFAFICPLSFCHHLLWETHNIPLLSLICHLFFPCNTSQVLLENHEGEAIRRRKEYLKGRGRRRKATTSAGRTEPGRWTSQRCQDLAHREVRWFGKAPCKRKKKKSCSRNSSSGFLARRCTCLLILFCFVLTCVLILTSPFPTCPHALLSTDESQELGWRSQDTPFWLLPALPGDFFQRLSSSCSWSPTKHPFPL